jgi:hypothetical protein
MNKPNPYKIKSSGDPRAKRIVSSDGTIVAFVHVMANGSWRLFDMDEKPISATSFATPAKACIGYRSMVEASE